LTDVLSTLNTVINDVAIRAESYGLSDGEAFFDEMNIALTDNGDVRQLDFVEYTGSDDSKKSMRVDGYSFESDDGPDASDLLEMTLVVADYNYGDSSGQANELLTINTADLEKKFLEMKRFISACSSRNLLDGIEGSAPFAGLVGSLTNNFSKLQKITLLYVTTARFTGRIKEFVPEDIRGIKINKQLYDIERHHAVVNSKDGSEPTQIDFKEYGFSPLTALKTSDAENTQSMLLAVPGELVFQIYEEHGARLLEQNVRTYLQARGNVNKGMITTLKEKPEMFFSYNNGLTATAAAIDVERETDMTLLIKGITNLQIVNGGQTTASIHYSKFKDKCDLSRVFVQMKLSVVDPDLLEEIVPKIAEYANTQNKVNAADFFANHPFHRQFEVLAKRFPSPRKENSITNIGSFWFYERARGAYNNETYKLKTKKEKDSFIARNPKEKLILKTDLAKYLMSFERHPDVVSKGAQAAFVQHANKIGLPATYKKQETRYNEIFYREAIAKTIIFREVDKLIQKASWYEGGGTKACTVTYSIAWLAEKIALSARLLDFEKIWKLHALSPELEEIFTDLAPKIYQELIESTPPHLSAVPQWAKRKGCWDSMKQNFSHVINGELLDAVCTSKELQREGRASARRAEKKYKKDEHWVAMLTIEPSTWQAMLDFCDNHDISKELSQNQRRDIMRLVSLTPAQLKMKYITEFEAASLLPLFNKLASLDFDFHRFGVNSCLYK
jgi:hypothetical protein